MEGSHIIKVGIYESALGGFPLFEQRDTITLATGGLYNITLGRGTGLPAKLTFDRQYFAAMDCWPHLLVAAPNHLDVWLVRVNQSRSCSVHVVSIAWVPTTIH